jgi:ABC-type multidrug transport system ATPase subunit
MYIQNTILFALAGYLSYVMPSEFGVRRPWYYALYRVCRQCTGIKKKRVVEGLESIDETELAELSKASDDLLVKKERHDVMCTKRYETAPLIIKNITKIYHRSNFSLSNCAIDGVTFAIEEGTVFGLLGCNGAGKSSLLGILTGLFESTSGTAFVAGYEVSKETKHVYRNIGICPQFNILWDQITVREHLLFYARIKGFRGSEENAVIRECMEQVELLDEEDILAKNLSCGQKRRLAIGIALIGNPKVIFMDEPTVSHFLLILKNGLDPIMRRQIWDIIHKIKKDRAIILSTHSMDEAQVCCQKVGIMKNGSFATIGTPFEICQAYSKRYNLTLKIDESNRQIAETFIVATLPFVKYQQQIFKNRDRFQFEASSTEIAHIFEVFKARSFTNSIISWQIGGYSLRDAFYNIHAPETDQDYETDVNDLEDMQYEL